MGTTLSLVYRDCKAPYRHEAFRRDKHHYMTTIDVQRAAAARLRAITCRSYRLRLVLACAVVVSLCCLPWPWELKHVIYRLALGGVVWVLLDQLDEFFTFRVELWRTSATAFLTRRELRHAAETSMRQLIVSRSPLPPVGEPGVRVRRALTL
ncbi:hypothetical protein SDRG_11371 [Saprolegnia diclina VS20]|uniref:Uncharacterized protein n=1 Tax=Saprolegnia diclina (strain VS20) TaxID=1156394 RepID=T0QBI4_SAPDV|nr:hypothetical protein SDRG_11371 [Saprolegnia diclina VS20]EQC30890.1 hypothetical protein SDRG_11371 [Saprolegnia diclina VS20]|eukprot:XP_008615628.1 hypothetical protein SDRG_11371 [Saprolegnia diclina VS20]